jgi:hypothetical protein
MQGHRLVLGLVRQHGAGRDVADHPHAGRARAVVVVADDASLGLHPDRLQAQALRVRTPADPDQHDVGFHRFGRAARGRLHRQHHALAAHVRAGDLGP